MASYSLTQAQADIAQLRGQINHLQNVLVLFGSNSVPTAVSSDALVYANAGGDLKYVQAGDGNAYNTGQLVAVSTATPSSQQTINSTSAQTITGCTANTAAISYRVVADIQYVGNQAAGTAQFQFGTSGTSTVIWGNAVFHDAVAGTSGYVARPTSFGPFGSPTLSTNNWMCTIRGFVTFTTAGAISLQAFEGTSSDTFKISNAILVLIPVS